jgi:hypothetical protein
MGSLKACAQRLKAGMELMLIRCKKCSDYLVAYLLRKVLHYPWSRTSTLASAVSELLEASLLPPGRGTCQYFEGIRAWLFCQLGF